MTPPGKRKKVRLALAGLLGLVVLVGFSGCQELSYYGQAAAGEYRILAKQEPIQELMTDPDTPPKLKVKFGQVLKIRQFAQDEMKLPADEVYLKYTDLHRPHVVWNVNVAPALSLDPKTWWFPIVGAASYRGYFHEEAAKAYAEKWKQKGWDVYVDGVDAYSTLGWFHDPLLNTFIYEPEADLADLIFHELAHRRLFVNGDTDFNESYATTVAAEGVRRWFAAHPNPHAYAEYQDGLAHDSQFIQLVMDTRQELQAVYDNKQMPDPEKLRRKEEIITELRVKYAALKKSWGGDAGYDNWFAEPINNAKLNTVSAYYKYGPAFRELIRINGGDMEKFYNAVTALGEMPEKKRHAALDAYLEKAQETEKSH